MFLAQDKKAIPGSPGKQGLAILLIQPEKQILLHYYMSILKEANSKMRDNGESDKSFKKRFTAERSRHLTSRRSNLFKCGWLFRKGEFVTVMEKLTELVHQRELSNGGKAECHFGKREETRFHTVSVQWAACFKAGRKIYPQFQCKTAKLTMVTRAGRGGSKK